MKLCHMEDCRKIRL